MDERTNMDMLQSYRDFAVILAEYAGKISLKYFRQDPDVEFKQDNTPVTIADRECERYICRQIELRYPDHSILGEESGKQVKKSEWQWIIDPIDGTKSFIRGVPLYSVLIALAYREESLVGVIHVPPTAETVAAAAGYGVWLNGITCRVSTAAETAHAVVNTTDYAALKQNRPDFAEALSSEVKSLQTWGDAYGYLMVAAGRADAMIDAAMAAWDAGPMKPIIEEAGGRFTGLRGEESSFPESGLASNGLLHPKLLALSSGE
jgi:histidinol phosphatase-like enzyme (inositol monophosphatase family)